MDPKESVVLVKLDGKEHVQGSAAHVAALEAKIDAAAKRADDLTTALTAAQTATGEMKAKLDAAEAKVKDLDVNKLVQDELAFRSKHLPILPKADGKAYDFTGKTREQVRADAVGAAIMADAAKLGSDAERAGYIEAHVKLKLDAVGKAPPPLHVPSPLADSADPNKPKRVDKRADAFAASWGVSPGAGAK
jgi:hypothetical protein